MKLKASVMLRLRLEVLPSIAASRGGVCEQIEGVKKKGLSNASTRRHTYPASCTQQLGVGDASALTAADHVE